MGGPGKKYLRTCRPTGLTFWPQCWLNLLGIFFWIKDSITDVKAYYWQYPCFTWSGPGDFTELQLGKPALLSPPSSIQYSASPSFDRPVKKKAGTQSKQNYRTANPVCSQDDAKVEELDQSRNSGSDLWEACSISFLMTGFYSSCFAVMFCLAILFMFFDHRVLMNQHKQGSKMGPGGCIVVLLCAY